MKYRKFNKYEKKEVRKALITEAMAGSGVYLYQNSSAVADLTLPRPTKSGVRKVGPGGQFQGDSYYMQMVKTGNLRLVEILQTPEAEAQVQAEKLILDQPDRVTNQGQVENVVEPTTQPQLNESDNQPKPDVLLNEGPEDDGYVIVVPD